MQRQTGRLGVVLDSTGRSVAYGFNVSHVPTEMTSECETERSPPTDDSEIAAAARANSLQRKLQIAEGKISELENLLGEKKSNHLGDKTSQPHKNVEFFDTTLTEISEIKEDKLSFEGDRDDGRDQFPPANQKM